jgi:hypothetical protein
MHEESTAADPLELTRALSEAPSVDTTMSSYGEGSKGARIPPYTDAEEARATAKRLAAERG